MRRLILAAAFVALTPLAFAQSNTGTMGGTSAPGTPGSMGNMGGMNNMGHTGTSSAAPMMGQASPSNCGTPDEPKACPPMPRRALQNYPPNRQ
jgi:hypothetical protein